MSVAALILEIAACVGLGAVVLRLLSVSALLDSGQRLAWSFILGVGLLGWLVFFVGLNGALQTEMLLGLLAVCALGIVFVGVPTGFTGARLSALERLLLALIALVALLDGFEGVAPPGDADSLTYHFYLPKQFLNAHALVFEPRAVDGAVPLLVQMTYVPALAIGGEKALTLWTMVSAWGVAFALYHLSRQHLGRSWSLALTLIWMTTPAVLFGSGSGQVEVRMAGFVIVAVAALMRARQTGLYRYVAVAGLATGMFVGTKYTGLMFGAACGTALFLLRHWPRQMLVFGVTSLLIGCQWYFWNWSHTGDPVFPMLFKIIGPDGYRFWDQAHQTDLEQFLFAAENGLPNNPLWMMVYPLLATFATDGKFDAERIGLGPYLLLLLPFAGVALWSLRSRIGKSPLLVAALIVAVYYVIWFLSGSSQRVRHLLALYPLMLLMASVAACRWANTPQRLRPLILAVCLTLGLQVSGAVASSLNYLRYTFATETRDAFLARNISGYDAVTWINRNLKPTDRILVSNRQLLYLVDPPVFFGHTVAQNLIDLRPQANDMETYYRQLRAQKITHILSYPMPPHSLNTPPQTTGSWQWTGLLQNGCAETVTQIPYRHILSRSLSVPQDSGNQQYVIRLTPDTCPIN